MAEPAPRPRAPDDRASTASGRAAGSSRECWASSRSCSWCSRCADRARRRRPIPGRSSATPLWSARRIPQTIVYDVGTQQLQAGLDQSVQGLDACFVVAAPSGLVASHQAGRAANPGIDPEAVHRNRGPRSARDPSSTTRRRRSRRPRRRTARSSTCGSSVPATRASPPRKLPPASPPRRSPRGTRSRRSRRWRTRSCTPASGRSPAGSTATTPTTTRTRYLSVWPASYRADREIGPLGALTVNDGFEGPDGSGPAARIARGQRRHPARRACSKLAASTSGRWGRANAPKDSTTVADARVAAAHGHHRRLPRVERQPHRRAPDPRDRDARGQGGDDGERARRDPRQAHEARAAHRRPRTWSTAPGSRATTAPRAHSSWPRSS